MTLQWNEDAGSSVGLAVGAGVFFGLIWVHETVSARAQRRTAAAALADLAKSQAAMEKKISRIQTKIDDVRATVGIGQGSGGQTDVVGEMRVIRGLLKKLTDKRSPGRPDAMTEDVAPQISAEDFSPAEILDIIRVGLEKIGWICICSGWLVCPSARFATTKSSAASATKMARSFCLSSTCR